MTPVPPAGGEAPPVGTLHEASARNTDRVSQSGRIVMRPYAPHALPQVIRTQHRQGFQSGRIVMRPYVTPIPSRR